MPQIPEEQHEMSLYLKTIFPLRYPPTEQSSKCPGSHNNAAFEGRSPHSEGWGHSPPSPVPGAPCWSGVSESCWIVSAQISVKIFQNQFCLQIRLWESSSKSRGIFFLHQKGERFINSLRARLRMLCTPEILLEAIYLIFLQTENKAYRRYSLLLMSLWENQLLINI